MKKESFPRSARICRSKEYRQLFSRGRRFETAHFFIYFLPSDLQRARLGLTVSRKAGNAVARNSIKRAVREVFRKHRPNAPLDILVSAKRNASMATHQEVETEFLCFLKNIDHEMDPDRSHTHL